MHYFLGIDEAGRGPWAGPLVVSGCLISAEKYPRIDGIAGLTDSKKLSPVLRAELGTVIEAYQQEGDLSIFSVVQEVEKIDRYGIREANRLAMEAIIVQVCEQLQSDDMLTVLVDGADNYRFHMDREMDYIDAIKKRRGSSDTMRKMPDDADIFSVSDGSRVFFLIGGDARFLLISAASIVAKTTRDRIMCEKSVEYPEYGFDRHMGYGTRMHQDAMLHYGITEIHRKSYAPVKALISTRSSI